MTTAITNILQLLEYNDYVDIIMIGVNNRASGNGAYDGVNVVAADVAAASMFSICADDFDLTVDNFTEDEKAREKIEKLLTTYMTSTDDCTETEKCSSGCVENNFEDIDYAYGLGQTKDSETSGKVEVLYDKIETYPFTFTYDAVSNTYNSAAELGLSFGDQRHAGELFTLYYIAKYINIIEDERDLNFSTTVQAIFNSFDAFATASRNTNQIFRTETLDVELAELIGVNLGDTNTQFSRYNLSKDCQDALEILEGYTGENRYIVLIPAESHTDNDNIYTITYEMLKDLNEEQIFALQNALVYNLTVMNPTQPQDNIRSMVSYLVNLVLTNGASDETYSTTLTWGRLQEFNENIYSYVQDLETTGALDILYSVDNTATITTTITSEFEITGVEKIEVTNFGGFTTSFDYEVTPETDTETGGTKVTIEFSNLTDTANDDAHIAGEEVGWGTSWSIDISIPVQLVDNAEFRTSDDDFKETNTAVTEASISRVRTITKDNSGAGEDNVVLGTESIAETVTVASPKLYKGPVLSIVKTGSVTSAEVDDTVDYTLVVAQTTEGTTTATNVVVTDTIPEGLTYVEESVAVTKSGGVMEDATISYADGVLTVGLGDVTYGDEIEITYSVTVDEGTKGDSLKNVAVVTSDNAGEDEDDWTVTVPADTLPKTGDSTDTLLPIIAFGASAVVLVAAFVLRKRGIR